MTATPTLRSLVLAGGRSQRFGRDKAGLILEGHTLLERTVSLLSGLTAAVLVSVRPDQQNDPLRRRYELLVDRGPEAGPAAGLLAAHDWDPRSAWLLVACDMPRLDRGTLEQLVAGRAPERGATAFRPVAPAPAEPLCAIYEPDTLAALARDAADLARVPHLSPRSLLTADIRWLDPPAPLVLASVNTLPEWESLNRNDR